MAQFHIEYFSSGPIAHAQLSHARDIEADTVESARSQAFEWVDREEIGALSEDDHDGGLRITSMADQSVEVWERGVSSWTQVSRL